MKKDKPRIFQSGRDMVWSLLLLVVVMIAVVAPTSLCSTRQGMPEFGPVQEVDYRPFLSLEARGSDHAVREPAQPAGWVANSARRTMIDGTPAQIVGWVTDDKGYVQLTQTGVSTQIAADRADAFDRHVVDTSDVAGYPLTIWGSDDEDAEKLWILDMGDARLMFSGVASDAEFRELAESAVAAPVLPGKTS